MKKRINYIVSLKKKIYREKRIKIFFIDYIVNVDEMIASAPPSSPTSMPSADAPPPPQPKIEVKKKDI